MGLMARRTGWSSGSETPPSKVILMRSEASPIGLLFSQSWAESIHNEIDLFFKQKIPGVLGIQ